MDWKTKAKLIIERQKKLRKIKKRKKQFENTNENFNKDFIDYMIKEKILFVEKGICVGNFKVELNKINND